MLKRPMVYVAGPIATGGDIPGNAHKGIREGEELRRKGYAVFVPHLSVLTEMVCGSVPWESWLEYDEEIIMRCDAVYRMKGESRGADREVKFAINHGIPVFYDQATMDAWKDAGNWHPSVEDQELRLEKDVTDTMQEEIAAWAEKNFPQSTSSSVLKHFEKEAKELIDSGDPVEAADCAMLLMHYARKKGFSLRDEIRKKFEINKKRTWGQPDKDGVVEHVHS